MLALKRILPHLAEDDEFITMFVDEAKLTVQLKHPNIVETYELGNFQSSYYILMEYIAGADILALQKRLRNQRRIMSVAQACFVAQKVARGLHYAHTACDEEGRPFNIIHRDVSPQNVRLTYDGRVKLIDFGIAKAAVQRTKTQVGVLKGKFGYMSPEQVHGEDIDHRSDVFALGTTLWEMLTNRRLFNGENEFETLQMVKHPEIPPPSEKNEQVPPAVDKIVMKALAADRQRRYQSAMELGNALEGFNQRLNEPYTQRHLSEWMADTFAEELAEERRNRSRFREIKRANDVKQFNQRYVDGEEQQNDESLVAGERELAGQTDQQPEGAESGPPAEPPDSDQIWDPDFAPDEGDSVDHERFAAEHTVVAAGGFDPSAFKGEEDDVISLAEDDIIELDEEGEQEPASDESATGLGFESSEAPTVDAAPEDLFESEPPGQAGGPVEQPNRAVASETGTQPAFDMAEAEAEQSDTKKAVRIASAVVAVVAVLTLAVVVGYMVLGSRQAGYATESPSASLIINVAPTPSVEGEFFVDGESRGKSPPVTVSELTAGTHEIEVRYPGYEKGGQTVELDRGALRTVTVELTPGPDAEGRISLQVSGDGEDTRVFVDGKPADWSPTDGTLAVEPGRHLVEVLAAGRRAWSRVVEVDPGASVVEHAELEAKGTELRIEATETSTVSINGEEVGQTPLSTETLDPSKIHEIAVESEEGRADWSSSVGFPRLGQGQLMVDFDEPPERYDEDDFGWLTARTGKDWWGVLVDGAQTGTTTPIESDQRLPVREGRRTITFRRGNQMHEVGLEVEAGETSSIDEDYRFEWSKQEL
jgi:serine/threonine protein kinase